MNLYEPWSKLPTVSIMVANHIMMKTTRSKESGRRLSLITSSSWQGTIPPPPPSPLPPMNNDIRFDHVSNMSYPAILGTSGAVSSYSNNWVNNGRPAMHTVTFISCIGHSASIGESFYEDDSHAKDEFYYNENNDYSWGCTFGTDEGDGIWLVTPKKTCPEQSCPS